MRRLALTLATAVLASGCIIGDDDDHFVGAGSAIVYWDFIRNAPAQLPDGAVLYDSTLEGVGTGPCVQSGVEVVTIDVAGLQQFVVDCVFQGVQGATLDGLPAGSVSARIRGWRGQVVVHDTTAALQVFDGQVTDQGIIDVDPVRAPIDLFGDLAFGLAPTPYASCAEAENPNISFELFDGYGTRIDAAVVGCSGPLPAPVFTGDLDLDNYTVRMQGIGTRAPFVGQVVFDSCVVPFDHFGTGVGDAGVFVTLRTQPVPTCQ
ncbi:MAG TPA: hypothetical protein VLC54_21040 [Anaeromyxobacter sp.]|nr:hypothetical protein [Anaeromyxobacter sp.]